MWQFSGLAPWARRLALRSLLLAGTTILLVPLALVAPAHAQVVVGIGVNPPMCSYGYYNYAPYGCAPSGFYGPGYFYNGIFLGVGPWANWGYGHGWGEHRFGGGGGGRYVAGRGNGGGHAPGANRGRGSLAVHPTSHSAVHANSHSNGGAHAAAAHGGASHGGGSHAGGGSHGGGEHH
jgi:hypothetical protein